MKAVIAGVEGVEGDDGVSGAVLAGVPLPESGELFDVFASSPPQAASAKAAYMTGIDHLSIQTRELLICKHPFVFNTCNWFSTDANGLPVGRLIGRRET